MNKNIMLLGLLLVAQNVGASWWCCGDSQAVKPYVSVDYVEQKETVQDVTVNNNAPVNDSAEQVVHANAITVKSPSTSNRISPRRMSGVIVTMLVVPSAEPVTTESVNHVNLSEKVDHSVSKENSAVNSGSQTFPIQLPISMFAYAGQNMFNYIQQNTINITNNNCDISGPILTGYVSDVVESIFADDNAKFGLNLANISQTRDNVKFRPNLANVSQTTDSFSALHYGRSSNGITVKDGVLDFADGSPLGNVRKYPNFNVPEAAKAESNNPSNSLPLNSGLLPGEQLYAQPKNCN
ncbi:MAG: hypothetical protein WC747_03715 [Candidatus Babeliales bacterium]|jgi:hypothetical protein